MKEVVERNFLTKQLKAEMAFLFKPPHVNAQLSLICLV